MNLSDGTKSTIGNTMTTVNLQEDGVKDIDVTRTIDPALQLLLDTAAQQQAEAETNTIPFISFKGKKFSNGDEKLGTVLSVVLLADVIDLSWYDRKYDPKSEETYPPACFSIGGEVPHETAPKPQHTSCDDCPKNQFKSAENGKGKVCRNGRRFLIAAVDNNGVNMANLAIINIAPTSLKPASKYIKSVNVVKCLPYWAVATKLSFVEDSDWPILEFTTIGMLSSEDLNKIAKNIDLYNGLISQPYDVSGYEEPDATSATKDTEKRKSKVS